MVPETFLLNSLTLTKGSPFGVFDGSRMILLTLCSVMTGTGSSGSSLRPSRHGGQGPEVQVNAPGESWRRLKILSQIWVRKMAGLPVGEWQGKHPGKDWVASHSHTSLFIPSILAFYQMVRRIWNDALHPDLLNITRIKDVPKRKVMILNKSEGLAMAAPSSWLQC